LREFENWLERLGCDCCMQGWMHVVDGNVRFDWTSDINGKKTKYMDIELYGKIED
jgi:hypothetical protein